MRISTHKKREFIIDIIFYSIIFALIYFGVKYLLEWFFPFLLAYMVVVSAQPAIRFLHVQLKMNRKIASLIITLLYLSLIVLFFYLVISRLINEVDLITSNSNVFISELPSKFIVMFDKFSDFIDTLPPSIKAVYQFFEENFAKIANNLSGAILGGAGNFLKKIPGIFISFIVFIVACTFISVDFFKITEFIKRQFPEKYSSTIIDSWRHLKTTLYNYLKAYTILILITFAELSFFFILLKVEFPLSLAALIALIDILPILGTGTILIPWGILAIISGSLWEGVAIFAIYVFVLIVRQILEPRIVGHQVGLNPFVALVSFIVGYKIFGMLGIFILPLIVIILKNLQDRNAIRIWKE